MRELWKKLADAIDARNTRERILILIASSAVMFMLMESLFVGPVLAQRKRLLAETRSDQAEVSKMATQVVALTRARSVDPDAALRAKLAKLAAQEEALTHRIEADSEELVPPSKMSAVLETMLTANPGLQLIEVKTLPRVAIKLAGDAARRRPSAAAKAAKPKSAGEPEDENGKAEMYRHGVEIAMRGGYLDLLAYLEQIESLPVRMFWDRVSLSAAAYPVVTMRLVVYTISLEKVWLTV